MESLHIVNWALFLIVTGNAIYLFISLVKTRYEFIKLGKKAEWKQTTKDRIDAVVVNIFGQKKLLKDKKSGMIHVMFFYGFLLVQFGAIDLIWKGLAVDSHLPLGPLYPFFTFLQEIVVFIVLVAVIWGFYRRYIEKLDRLKRSLLAGLVYLLIGGLMISTLLANGMALVWHGHELTWSEPIASAVAYLFNWLPTPVAAGLFFLNWWLHLLFILSFLVYIPQGKHAHLIAGTVNVFLGRTHKVGQLASINFEDEDQEIFGIDKIEGFNQKQLLDLYSCVE